MAGAVKRLYRAQPTVAAGGDVAYTAPAATKTVLKEVTVTNTANVPSDAEVHVVGTAAGAISAATMLIPAPLFPPKSTTTFQFNLVLEAGETIRVRQTTPTSCTLHISGVEGAP